MKLRKFKKFLRRFFFVAFLMAILTLIYMYFSFDVTRLNKEYPHLIKLQNNEVDIEIKAVTPRDWTKMKDISRFARWSIILSEDWSFFHHEGIDLEQIKVALGQMVEEKKFRGASTITQQMVKNLYLSQERTIWRKIHEMILAQKVEKVLSKNKILEIYFNVIEFGPGIYGIRSACKHYFNKSPSQITPREGAFLAMLLPSPKKYYQSFKQKELTPYASERIKAILTKMKMAKIISPEDLERQKNLKFIWER